jgi:hypothetical protein
MIYVYELVDPRDNRRRYVGQTSDKEKRLDQHCANKHYDGNFEKSEWIDELTKLGLRPRMGVLEECANPWDADAAEKKWIIKSRGEGFDILNRAVGGNSRAVSPIVNSTRRDWIELGYKVKCAYMLLMEAKCEASRLVGKTDRGVRKLGEAESAVISAKSSLDERVYAHFKDWEKATSVFYGVPEEHGPKFHKDGSLQPVDPEAAPTPVARRGKRLPHHA